VHSDQCSERKAGSALNSNDPDHRSVVIRRPDVSSLLTNGLQEHRDAKLFSAVSRAFPISPCLAFLTVLAYNISKR
jgi:hypothetical protein